ncbi:phosphoribosyl-AMP cyclohydrolase [Desulfococcaceae bacterium HSG7]|nr:phosphoribosyl-AMP cyclohydrolase [Desulfococcaceae bacterium HSG7]
MIKLNFEKMDGLIPAIAQDYLTGEVLMVGFMNEDAWRHTLASGEATYFSRTRQTLWTKGKTSGNLQIVKEIRIDCDDDTVLLKVEQVGGASCHLGYRSCFFKKVDTDNSALQVIGKPVFDPKDVYNL